MIEGYHWALWGMSVRKTGVKTGYPSQSVGYTPPKVGNVMGSSDKPLPDDGDWLLAERINDKVLLLARIRPEQAKALRHLHGAYHGAPATVGERIRDSNMKKGDFYRLSKDGASWVEGALSSILYPDTA